MGVPYQSNAVVVATTVGLLVSVTPENDGVLIQNTDATNPIFVGGPNVTAATGLKIDKGVTQLVPSVGGIQHDLYAIATGAAVNVRYLQPGVE